MTSLLVAIALVIASAASSPAAAQATAPARAADREITVLRGDLYTVRDGKQHTVFLVTPDGIVLADPLNVDTAQWLAEQFATRFPGVPVRYVILTHHHPERASGGSVFRRTAELVAHAEFRDAVNDAQRARPNDYRFVPMPASTFTDRRTIEIGGKKIELIHMGPFHARDMTLLAFAAERTVFAADAPPLATAPFAFGSLEPAEVTAWLEAVTRIDFDTIVLSDGTTSTRRAVAQLAEYLGRLRAAVLIGYERGRSLETLQDTLVLDAYQTLPHYAARREHIAAIYRRVRFQRADVTLTGIANYSPQNPQNYCALYELCRTGGAVLAASVAATVVFGRRFGLQGEFSLSQQFWNARARPLYDEEVVFRPTRGALLLRYTPVREGLSYALLAGVSRTVGDVRGMDRVQGRLAPAGGRHALAAHDLRYGFTAGVELSQRIGPLRLVLPIRVTQIAGVLPTYWPSRFDVYAGAGLSIPVFRRLE